MKRRKAILTTAGIAGLSAAIPSTVRAAGMSNRIGDMIIPPEKETGKEKHVPVITAPAQVKADEPFMVTVEVGSTVPHPNTVEHHIKWIQLYSLEDDSQYVVNVGTFELGPTFAEPKITLPVKVRKNSTLFSLSYCNIHGLWDYSTRIVCG